MKHSIHYLVCCILLLAMSCHTSPKETANDGQGTVVYSITYTDSSVISQELGTENDSLSQPPMLPTETNLFFKGNRASFITPIMGIAEMVNLLDNGNKKFTSLLNSSFGESIAFTEDAKDVEEQETNPAYEFEMTDEIKTIAGLECNKAIVSDLTNNKKFDIYYYKKVKVYLGNSPYKDFNYLLMDYRDTKMGLPMHLHATKVDFNAVDTSMVSLHGNFNWVDKKTFISSIKNMRVPPVFQ